MRSARGKLGGKGWITMRAGSTPAPALRPDGQIIKEDKDVTDKQKAFWNGQASVLNIEMEHYLLGTEFVIEDGRITQVIERREEG